MKKYILFLFLFPVFSAFAQLNKEIDSIKQLLETATGTNRIILLNNLSEKYQRISIEKTIEVDIENMELCRELGERSSESNVLNNLGIDYYMLGDYSKALVYFELSLEIKEEIGDTTAIVKTLNNLGVISQITGNIDKALKYLERSLIFKLRMNDKLSIGKTLNNIGVIYMDCDKLDQARDFYLQALNIYTEIEDKPGMAAVFNNIGQVFDKEKMPDSALYYYQQSLSLKKELDDRRGIGNTLNNIGLVYQQLNQDDKAILNFREAMKIREQIGDKFGIASTMNYIASLHLKSKNYSLALKYYTKSNEIAKSENLRGIIIRNYEGLTELNEVLENYPKALEYFKKYSDIKDSIFSEETTERLADLKVKYEIEKIENENEILKHKNEIQDLQISLYQRYQILLVTAIILVFVLGIGFVFYWRYRSNKKLNAELQKMNTLLEQRVKERTRELEQANATKDQFFSIIAHDLKNPFNAILGFSEVLSDDFDNISDSQKKEFAFYLKESSKNIYDLLVNLLEWASSQTGRLKLYSGKIDMKLIVDNTITNLNLLARKKNIKLISEIRFPQYAYADETTIKTVVRNLISNAIKFTNKGGEIRITSEIATLKDLKDEVEIQANINAGDFIKITVEDTGVGINKENLKNLFNLENKVKTKGTEKEPGTGLGLIICREFVEMNKGSIWVESELGKGSKFSFIIPVFKS